MPRLHGAARWMPPRSRPGRLPRARPSANPAATQLLQKCILIAGEALAVVAWGDHAVGGAHAVLSVAFPDGGGRSCNCLESISRQRDPQVQAPRGHSRRREIGWGRHTEAAGPLGSAGAGADVDGEAAGNAFAITACCFLTVGDAFRTFARPEFPLGWREASSDVALRAEQSSLGVTAGRIVRCVGGPREGCRTPC